MAIPAYNTRILTYAYDLSGSSNALKLNIDAQSIEYNIFQQAAKQFIAGDPVSTLEHSGYYESPGIGTIEREMYDRLGTGETQVAAILGTDQTIPVAYVLPVSYNSQLTVDSPVNNLITVKGKWSVGSGRLYRGYQLWIGTINATGAKPGVDFVTAGAGAGKAWMFMRGNVGTVTNATVQVQSDDNSGFTTPTARGTFTFSTADRTQQIDLSAAERYLRINVTSLGGATSFHLTVIAGVDGVTM